MVMGMFSHLSIKHLHGTFNTVVWGTVPNEDSAIPPMRILFVEFCNQMLHEDTHHALIGV